MNYSFDDLNVYCLENIFKHLSLEDQLTGVLVSACWRDIIKSLWRRQYLKEKKLTFSLGYIHNESISIEKNEEGFEVFLSVICECAEELSVFDASLLKLLATRKWPKLKRLNSTVKNYPQKLTDPVGLYAQFPALESLDLSWGVKFHDPQFRETLIQSITKRHIFCEQLVELFLDIEEVSYWVRREIKTSRIICEHRDPSKVDFKAECEYMEKMRSYVDHLRKKADMKSKIIASINFKNLRKLDISGFCTSDLRLEAMPQLEEVRFRNARILGPGAELDAFRSFVKYAAACVEKQVKDGTREKPLKLHCTKHEDVSYTLGTIRLPAMLLLTVEPPLDNYEIILLPTSLKNERVMVESD